MVREQMPGATLGQYSRRAVLVAVCASLWAGRSRVALAQAEPNRRIAILMPYPASDSIVNARVSGFREELGKLGWMPPEVEFVERWVGDDLAAIRRAADELSALKVDIVLTTGSRVVPILQQVTRTIPIVFTGISDPVGQKLVASLARPGGNTTGNTVLEFIDGRSPLMAKLVDIVRQLAPVSQAAGLVYNPANPASAIYVPSFEAAAAGLGWTALRYPVRDPSDIERAFGEMAGRSGTVAVLPSDLSLLAQRQRVVALAAQFRIPAVYSDDGFVDLGGLAAYSADRAVLFRRAASYVDRILRGEAPAGMPIEQPTRYELSLNLKTARDLGLQVPATLLAQADDVID